MPLLKQILTKLKDIDIRTITGQEIATNEYLDGKRIYRKKIYCGVIPENSVKRVSHGLTNVTIIYFTAIGRTVGGSSFTFPYADLRNNRFSTCQVSKSEIILETNYNIESYDIYADLYYIKN